MAAWRAIKTPGHPAARQLMHRVDRYPAAGIWESDAELEAFLADLRASRNASLA